MRRTYAFLLGAAVLPFLLAAAGTPLPRRGLSSGAPKIEAAQASGVRTMRFGGRTRSYVVRAPRGAAGSATPLPLVIVMHGGGGNAANAEQMTGFTALVERERVIVVYPEGTSRRERIRLYTWNAGHCCGSAMEQQVDDVGFVNAMLDSLAHDYPLDATRIYATGMSNGAMMSHRLGRELSHRIVAIAPVVGAVFGDEHIPPNAVSAIMINGVRDKAVPMEGGQTNGRFGNAWDGTPTQPNIAQGTFWAKANGCATTPTREERGADITTRWSCPSGRRVELHQLTDNGHAWPGGQRGSRLGDAPTTAMQATEDIWAFFKTVVRPR
ncbi:MAG: polyhydroxybutyrate depolymerase [Gemmatimonadaceae bacterium]|nr:polyhydroxybutyrate depolymerase [Gemmatimonadaceae bacterium]